MRPYVEVSSIPAALEPYTAPKTPSSSSSSSLATAVEKSSILAVGTLFLVASRPVSPCVHIVRPACYGISWYGALRGLGLVTKRRATHHSLHGIDHGESAAWQGGGSIRGTYIGLGSLKSGLFMHGPLKQYTTTPSPSPSRTQYLGRAAPSPRVNPSADRGTILADLPRDSMRLLSLPTRTQERITHRSSFINPPYSI